MEIWSSQANIASSSKKLLTIATSLTASVILFRNIASDLIPYTVQNYFYTRLHNLSSWFSSRLTIVVQEFDGLITNQMFEAINTYLGTFESSSTQRIKVLKAEKEKQIDVTIDMNQELIDIYKGVKFKWILVCSRNDMSLTNNKRDNNAFTRSEVRHYELNFHKKHRDMALKSYLTYILHKAKAIREERKTVRLHTVDYNGTDYWSWINMDHPATFETMALEPEMKNTLIEDLDRFMERKEYYKRVGKAWKRGYLLYGPPGTGKSSLVAAMANYLKFDVYDLDLREVQCNSDLRRLLIGTASRSILVIEDIDCSIQLPNRDIETECKSVEDDKVSLSGLLNFIDGLWSSCGDQRILVFTTNYKERLDPALLRPGRIDVQLHMTYCTFSGFRILAKNYLQIEEHPLLGNIEELLLQNVKATPAEVVGELMKSDRADVALQGLVRFLQRKTHGI